MDAEGADGAASTPVERDAFGQMDALLPDGRVQVVTVPDAWVDRSPAVLFPATLAAIEGLIRSSPKRPDEDGRGEVAVRTALGVDGEPLAEFCTCLLMHHLVESHRKLRPEIETPPQRPGGLLDRVATKLTAEMLGEEGYVEKLARWLVMSASGWSSADREADKDKVARRLLYLIAVYGSESANAVSEMLLPPERPLSYLDELLGVGGDGTTPASFKVPKGMLVVLSAGHFHSLREALYKNSFRRVEDSPWPTAVFQRDGSKGYAQLRPAVMDYEPLLSSQQVEAWASTMWKQQRELSDLDADALDALCAIYLAQAKGPDDTAVAEVDEILAMRGLKPKRGGQGRRGGYEPEQRAEMLKALSHIQNLWINMAEVKVYEDRARKDGKPATIKTLQSRPFIITDRMGQFRLDGYLDVERFIFRPGRAFAAFLVGTGRQTGLLFQKALQYDPIRRRWEKRLTRYISWQLRAGSRGRFEAQVFTVATLLDAVGETLNERYPAKTRTRLEKALSQLAADGVVDSWRYPSWAAAETRGWQGEWLEASVILEIPDAIKAYQVDLAAEVAGDEAAASTEPYALLLQRRRKAHGLSQQTAADALGIRQGYYSKLERGIAQPSTKLKKRLDAWLADAG